MIPINIKYAEFTITGTPISIDGDNVTIKLDSYIKELIVPMGCISINCKELIIGELAKQNKPKKRGKK